MSDVFLSYARADRGLARSIVSSMEAHGFSVWWDSRIEPGTRWDGEIERALRNAKCIVVVWTPISVDREWVHIEAHFARKRGILLPILIGCNSAPIAFSLIQSMNLTGWSSTGPEPKQLAAAVRQRINGPAPNEVGALETPPASTHHMVIPDALSFRKYIDLLKQTLVAHPEDEFARLALAMTHARLGLHDLARQSAQEMVDRHPSNADGYVYLALAALRGKRPRVSTMNVVRDVEALISASATLDPERGDFDVILAAIKFDYYVSHGLKIPQPTPQELLSTARQKQIDRIECLRVLQLAGIDGPIFDSLRKP